MRTLFIRYEGFKKRSDALAAVLRVGGGREKEDEGENCISRTPGRTWEEMRGRKKSEVRYVFGFIL